MYRKTLALVAFALAMSNASAQKIGEASFSAPTKSGDETITVRWKDGSESQPVRRDRGDGYGSPGR